MSERLLGQSKRKEKHVKLALPDPPDTFPLTLTLYHI
jgi:hypothetical protein